MYHVIYKTKAIKQLKKIQPEYSKQIREKCREEEVKKRDENTY